MMTTAPSSASDGPSRTDVSVQALPAPSPHPTEAHKGPAVRLVGRRAEQEALHELLDSVRAGISRAVVIRGEPGAGKSAFLQDAVDAAPDLQIVRIAAVESEQALAFAGVHQLLHPLLPVADRVPEPQKRALHVAFGQRSGPPADRFLVGLAVLTLLSRAAESRPLLCVVDDAQWLDDESANILGFVARRLLADPVGVLVAAEETTPAEPRLPELPEIGLRGLSVQDAGELLAERIGHPVDGGVTERLVTGTGGNPLALLEAVRDLSCDQLAGRAPLPEPVPIGHRLEESFARRIRELSPESRMLLLLAAADQPGRPGRLWRAAAALGIPESAAVAAEEAGVAVFWPSVLFCHPLVRSAVYATATTFQRRRAHQTLAAASDGDADIDIRAWHLAAAAAGPDEEAAAEQEAAAERARSRGGYAAAATLLERAALLTAEPERQAERRLSAAQAQFLAGVVGRADELVTEAIPALRNPLSQAQATRLRGRIQYARGEVAEATATLFTAAQRLQGIAPRTARDALLSALEATVFAGWAATSPLLHLIARVAGELPPTGEPPNSPANLLLRGLTVRVTDGYAAAVPDLRRAVQAFCSGGIDRDLALHQVELAAIAAADLLDDAAVDELTGRWIQRAREAGALARLAVGLAFRSVFVDAPQSRLTAARAGEAEAHELGEVTGNSAVVPPTGAHTLAILAWAGREAQARETAGAVAQEAPRRGAVGEMALATSSMAILELGLGNYEAAVAALLPAWTDDTPLVGTRALPDLVEAAVRAGKQPLAAQALARLDERARATGTPLALGLLARSGALLAAPDRAREDYEAALRLLRQTGAEPQIARAHLLYGEWLRRQRRRREARDQLRTAHEMFDALHLDAFAERARVELRATGEQAQRRQPGHPEKLTSQEARIAALVSRGEANRDIATQLFISPSTVEYHLHKVFRKLDVTSRTQLARRVLDTGAAPLVPASSSVSVAPAG
jgi:DNA-binding CsgD family transcriptional regulator